MGLDITAFRKLRVVENPEEYAKDELWTGGAVDFTLVELKQR